MFHMDLPESTRLLESVRKQQYPLTISSEAAWALVECFQRIMAEVPEDRQAIVRGDYALATSALQHPTVTE